MQDLKLLTLYNYLPTVCKHEKKVLQYLLAFRPKTPTIPF